VYAGDKNGTFELKTPSTDLSDILTSLANAYAAKYHTSYTLAGHYTDSPTVERVGSSQSFFTQEQQPGWLFGTLVCEVATVCA